MSEQIQIKIKCQKCGEVLAPEATFCHSCGLKQGGVSVCASCNTALESDWSVCPDCGKALNDDKKRELEAEQQREADERAVRKRAVEDRKTKQAAEALRLSKVQRQERERPEQSSEEPEWVYWVIVIVVLVSIVWWVRHREEEKIKKAEGTTGQIVAPAPVSAPAPVVATPVPASSQNKNDVIEFVKVTGGCFQMGDTFGDGDPDEKTVHEVCLSDFSIGKYEVTQGQWKRVMGSNPSYFSSCGDDCPVEQVSWDMVQEFIRKLNSQSGRSYRLPTEAEWEYAARSGGKREKYSGGDNVDAVAWYDDNLGGKTRRVGTKQPNGLGIYDMSGNVWEWCSDWYGNYESGKQRNPQGSSGGSYRVFRGGSWNDYARNTRASYRSRSTPGGRLTVLGFRVLLPPVQ